MEIMHCAGCGITGGDDIKLRNCTACYLVRYCSVKCQKEHRPKHKKECKKRAAELRDEILFKQPECSYLGDCPICCLPLPIKDFSLYSCCCQRICHGCDWANKTREFEGRQREKCLFCRQPMPKSGEEAKINYAKRAEANDPVALSALGGHYGNKGDDKKACEYWTKAAELGDINAHYNLSISYRLGQGVEKNEEKGWHHLEKAAIGGHPIARRNLGCKEGLDGREDRAIKHFIIAANMGDDDSLGKLKVMCRDGIASKEDFASALRGYKAAVDATESPQRKAAEAAKQQGWQTFVC